MRDISTNQLDTRSHVPPNESDQLNTINKLAILYEKLTNCMRLLSECYSIQVIFGFINVFSNYSNRSLMNRKVDFFLRIGQSFPEFTKKKASECLWNSWKLHRIIGRKPTLYDEVKIDNPVNTNTFLYIVGL